MRGRGSATLHTKMTTPPEVDLDLATGCWNEGRLADAEHLVRHLLDVSPNHPMALQMLGALCARQGRAAEALAPLQRACALQPDSASALHNLSNVFALLGRRDEALASLEASLALEPDNPVALMTQARMLMELQQPIHALRKIERALTLQPDWALAWQCRGDVLAMLMEAGMNRRTAAVASFQRALELGGDAEELSFSLAVLGEGAPPAEVPAKVVRALFDAYAPNFEQHLTRSLNYRTPEHIGQVLQRANLQGALGEVWDMGCGTGLCAPLLRPLAQRLVGVDLSPGMLKVAQGRGTYDALHCADIVTSLQGRQADIDLLVAADVFVYIGGLDAVFDAATRALRRGGHLLFSIEANERSDSDFTLLPTRRFAHAIAYIERLAATHGFRLVERQHSVLREELGQEVAGWVVLLQIVRP